MLGSWSMCSIKPETTFLPTPHWSTCATMGGAIVSANWGWAIREENFWGGPLQCHTVTLQCSNHMFSRIWGWVVAYPAHPLAPPMRSIGTRGMQWYVRRACVTNKGSDDTLGLTMQKFVEIRWIRCGPNLKIAEFIIYKFKKIKNQKKICKKTR
jgi:hypothetical protein